MRLKSDTKLAPADGVLSASLGDGKLALLGTRSDYFGLDGTGARIWQLIANGADTPTEIAYTLSSEYAVAQDECLRDVKMFVSSLVDAGLVSKSS